jgi:hypothetical protein
MVLANGAAARREIMPKVDKLLHVGHAIADNRKRPEVEKFLSRDLRRADPRP